MENSTEQLFAAPVEPEFDNRSIETLVKDYIATRDAFSLARTDYTTLESGYKETLAKLSMRMRELADDAGVDSFSIRGVGTAYRSTKVSYRVVDWDSFISWIKATDNFQCIEKRAAKLSVAAIHKDTSAVPAGLDYIAEQEFMVRKS